MICENFPEAIDPALNSVVYREVFEMKGDTYLKFNDNQLEFHPEFRLYMISALANPHFSPEVHTRTRVLNFSVTREGLEQ